MTDAPFERGREAANLAIGGILGAYLGLGISKNGLAGGSNWDLAGLILMIALFAGLMNEMPSFFTGRFSWNRLILYFNLCGWTGIAAFFCALRLGIDENILRTILLVWAALIASETIYLFNRRKVIRSNG